VEAMHSLLKRQLKRYFGDSFTIPHEWQPFVKAVNDAYREFDSDRGMLERSLELSSHELLQANSEMRAVFQAIPDFMLRLDREGVILDYAAGNTNDFVLEPKQLLGKKIQDVPLKEIGAEFKDAVQHVGATQTTASIEYCLMIEHQKRCFEARLLPLLDNQIIVIIRNITERRAAEKKYRSIYENAIEGIYQTALDGRILSANPAFARMLHYDSPEELRDRVMDVSRHLYVHAERRQELLALIEERGIAREFEVQFYRKDQSVAWISLNTHAVRNGHGEILYLEGSAQDITDRKALESRLLQAQKMEAIGTLAGGIAHDFNNILAAIMGYTEMTKSRLRQQELHGYLERVLKASERAKNLVAQILTFSRSVEHKIRPIHIGALTSEALKLLRATLPSTITIHQRIAPRVKAILADPTQIHQVLINLCTNAAHAMRENGGTLDISVEDTELVRDKGAGRTDLKPGSYVKLTVADSGTGIKPETVHRIFDPFFTTKGLGEGTGLGLSVVYGIVSGYGGTVTVQSNPGAGSSFSVYFPALAEDAEAEEEPLKAFPKGCGRVLFVDDEEILVDMGRDMLEGLGYQVTATTDSTRALEIFCAAPERFELVITDMTMPGMTGVELSRKILSIRPQLPIILCTGYSELITEDTAKALGIQGFAMKPLSLGSFAELISQVLNFSG
jgi:two-component system, cell cycle sensor histidine kinase and response regulator CckA